MKHHLLTLALSASATLAQAGLITTTNLAEVAAFQQGLSVQTLENVSGRTPFVVDAYPADGIAVGSGALVYDQVPGFQFSSGFKPGEVMAGLFRVETNNGGGDADSASSNTVLAGLSPLNETQFNNDELIEAYLPNRVSSLGFWLSPDLGKVRVIFSSSNFAFNRDVDEEIWESVVVEAGQFVGLSRANADIGGLKITALSEFGFAIDDLSFGGTGRSNPIPEPASAWLVAAGLLASASASRRRAEPVKA